MSATYERNTMNTETAPATVVITIHPPTSHEPRYAIFVDELSLKGWTNNLDATELQPTLEMAENAAAELQNKAADLGLVAVIRHY